MYRLLLRLLPRHRRHVYGEEMRGVFNATMLAARLRGGRWAAARLWIREMVGMMRFAVTSRLTSVGPSGGGPIVRDLRWAWRGVRARGWRAVVIVLLCGVTLGANAVVFSAADAFVLRPVPYTRADELVILQRPGGVMGDVDYTHVAAMLEWRKHRDIFVQLHGHERAGQIFLTTGDVTDVIEAQQLTPGLLEMLGVLPSVGRPFIDGDGAPGTPKVAIISDALARRLFGSPASALGQLLPAGDASPSVIGVMPPAFRFPGAIQQAWTPLHLDSWDAPTYTVGLRSLGRLHPNLSVEDSNEMVGTRWPVMLEALPEQTRRVYLRADTEGDLRVRSIADFAQNTRAVSLFGLLSGAALCLLLITCANVVNLELSVAALRQRTHAVQAALGAPRWSLLRATLAEGAILIGVSAAVGLGLATLGTEILARELPVEMRSVLSNPIDVDGRTMAFMTAVALVVWLVVTLPSVFNASARSVISGLRHDPRTMPVSSTAAAARHWLMIAQVGFTVVLLTGALLSIQTYEARLGVDTGLDAEAVVTLEVYPADRSTPRAVVEGEIVTRLRTMPGVRAVARTDALPPSTAAGSAGELRIVGREDSVGRVKIASYHVDPEYLNILGIPIVEGSSLGAHSSPEDVVIDEHLAKAYWPGSSAVGARLYWGGGGGGSRASRDSIVVGVARAVRTDVTNTPDGNPVFVAYRQLPPTSHPLTFVIKVDKSQTAADIAAIARSSGPRLRVRTDTVEQRYARLYGDTRLAASIGSAFGVLAWAVAAAGIYAVMAFLVAGRTREIGIRMALGADELTVRRMVLQSSLRAVMIGVTLGLVVSALAYQSISAQLFGVAPTDPQTYAAVTGLVVVTALLATWLPARRAARVNPAITLRSE